MKQIARLAGIMTLSLIAAGVVLAQEQAKPTAKEIPFSAEQKLTLDNLQLRASLNAEQIRSRQAELAVLERQKADINDEATKTITSWAKPGYEADLQGRRFVLKPEPPKAPAAPPKPPGD